MIVRFNYVLLNVATLFCLINQWTPNNIFISSAEEIDLMPFYYVQDAYQKNQLGTRLDKRIRDYDIGIEVGR